MTMPDERTRALIAAGEFLSELQDSLKTPGVPDVICEYALRVLTHAIAGICVATVVRAS
ncbi:BPSL0761 family protein [Rugamonas sp. DEMB1]|uniref:BPSL0761 family protein n=1 Tax=Rugamonas sp. DEMB1 TaxID=3039386 RepID=UPI00391AF85D